MIHLSAEQRKCVQKGEPVRVYFPDIGGDVVVLSAGAYEEICADFPEERMRRIISAVAVRNAAGRMNDEP